MKQNKRESSSAPLLQVDSISVDYWNQDRWVTVVDQVSFEIRARESVGLVGESGCGKTTTLMSVMRLLPASGRITNGSIRFKDMN
ncbi:MAG: ATP-binding cassette domain-containing protein, partial [Candidatus Aminicenantales bacterium]